MRSASLRACSRSTSMRKSPVSCSAKGSIPPRERSTRAEQSSASVPRRRESTPACVRATVTWISACAEVTLEAQSPPFGVHTPANSGRAGACAVEISGGKGKLLAQLGFQVGLGGLGGGQDVGDLEIVHGREGADIGPHQDVGGDRLELLARDG